MSKKKHDLLSLSYLCKKKSKTYYMRNIAFTAIVLLGAGLAIYLGYKSKSENKPLRYLPFYGNHEVKPSLSGDGADTIYKSIADFSFIDQKGNKVTQDNFKNSIYVADYFFCTCQSICPVMSKQMERVAEKFKDDDEIKFISHTVNPEYDSVNVLADYAKAHNAVYGKWYLVTGNKKDLYDLARDSYMLDASEGDGGEEDFIHTQNFALIDKERHIRGYYDGTNPKEIDQLINDIGLLKKEYAQKAKN
jgi:protein SCO1/2